MLKLAASVVVTGMFYGLGFLLFLGLLPNPTDLPVLQPKAMVVFTGGSGRIDGVVKVLRRGVEGPVLISGVHSSVRVWDVLPHDIRELHGTVELDYAARTTRENVLNTALWAERKGVTELTVVTNRFHAPRVRVLLLLLAPQLQTHVWAIRDDVSLRTLWHEYNKFLVSPFLM